MDKKTIIIIASVLIGILGYYLIKAGLWVYRTKNVIQQRKNLILEETNHEELLRACQNILEKNSDYYEFNDPDWPLVIKKLKPSYVHTNKNEITIEMGGGFFSFGVIVCEDEPDWPDYEVTKLLDDLWFYEEK